MAKQVINTGTAANSKNGDPLRTAFEKVNANFDELYRNLVSYLPNPAGLSGKFLSTNGTDLLWTSAVKLIQSNTPPDGDSSTLWYDRLGGRVYTWYDDAWVDASPALSDFQLIPPASPQGAIGDVEGMWSGDFNYYYYCSDNFTGNNAPIWRRVAFDTSNNWAVYNGGGGASLPANAVGYLYNNGSGTITWTPNTQGYTLPQATTSVLGGVKPDGTSIVVNSGVISAATQVNADWDSSSGVSAILNKPTIPAAQIQSDWTVTDNTLKSFIRNKPTIPSLSNFAFSANQLTVTNNGAIRLFTNTHNWSFNNNGSLTYPDNSIQVTAYTGTTWPSQVGQGGKFLTTDGNILSWATVAGGGGLSISDFGEGFSLTDTNKIVTNKLYNNDITQPTQRYRLELTSTGVVVLPDQSVINGATLKTVAGNYAGITAGPAGSTDEDSWVWVDNNGATIATKYSTDAHTWTFDNIGKLTTPGGLEIYNEDGVNSISTTGGLYITNTGLDQLAIIWNAGDNELPEGQDVRSTNIFAGSSGLSIEIINDADVSHGWNFNGDSTLSYPENAVQRDTATVTCAGNTSTVIYTASSIFQYTVKLLIQVEGNEGASVDWDTQACEMIIARSVRANTVASSVYGIVYTSTAPLATFTADWNATSNRIEVICTTPSANEVYVRTFATEIQTSP